MASPTRFALSLITVSAALGCACPISAQVFVVGERSATADIATDFKPTRVDLPTGPLTERGRRDLIRSLVAEQGFAHRALPLGNGLTLRANGNLAPGGDLYRRMIYEKGQSAAPGDRVIITALNIKPDRIILDLNGGPYEKHRILSHIQINGGDVVARAAEQPTGARVTLLFEHEIPDLSAPEVKSLLEPVIDFGLKTSDQAYADTLPVPLKDAIAAHDVLVGMNRRMVLAALGAPESKMRERDEANPNGNRYEEWIYGHVPETVRFVRFQGDRVVQVEIAELGKSIQIHKQDEVGGLTQAPEIREIALGDKSPVDSADHAQVAPPTLRQPGEAAPAAGGQGRVQYPAQPIPAPPSATDPTPVAPTAAPPTPGISQQPNFRSPAA